MTTKDIKSIFLTSPSSNKKICIAKKYGKTWWAEGELECILNQFFYDEEDTDYYEIEFQMNAVKNSA